MVTYRGKNNSRNYSVEGKRDSEEAKHHYYERNVFEELCHEQKETHIHQR